MLDWKNVLSQVGSTIGDSAGDCILEFLRVLPEEVTEGRKINLTVSATKTTGLQQAICRIASIPRCII